jgi:hypothetical protein
MAATSTNLFTPEANSAISQEYILAVEEGMGLLLHSLLSKLWSDYYRTSRVKPSFFEDLPSIASV